MNYKMVFKTVGRLLQVEALLMFLPLLVSIYYEEKIEYVFLITIGLLFATSLVMTVPKTENKRIYAREGLVIVSLSWILMSLFGALPYLISGAIPSPVDAFFETVSGFSTTGATILVDIEALPKCLLFWRSFTHWIGGMGIIVFVLAFLPKKDMQSMHILRAEVPGPSVGKLVSKTAVTARILYIIYTVFTIAEIVALLCCDMPLFDSVTTAFSTAGTGGFAIRNASIASYNNFAAEMVITVFMALFGINFNLFYLLLIRQFKRAFKSEELWTYLIIIFVCFAIITVDIYPIVESLGTALRQSIFQVVSVITTTGFVTADFNKWPVLSQMIIIFLMFLGACSGSTGGGLKVGRVLILAKTVFRELRRAINPSRVKAIKLDGALVDNQAVCTNTTYFLIYIFIIGVSVLLLSFNHFDFSTTLTAVVTCISNLGPGLSRVGPIENFSAFSDFSKLVLCADMLIGRLEIFPMIVIFMPATWRKSV